jgi:hypothetical protein
MKEISIIFAEWVGVKTFNGRYMHYDVSKSGISRWKIYNEDEEISTHELYQKFCDQHDSEFRMSQKILYWDGEFQPTNFVEYVAKKGLFYYKSSYKGVAMDPIWTNKKGSIQLTTSQLWEKFQAHKL